MKKNLFIIAVIAFVYSCKKSETAKAPDPTFCWKCYMYKSYPGIGLDLADPIISTRCDSTQAQIDKYVSDNTIKVISGNSTKLTQIINCTKQ
ncbi:hypothetical protein FO440_12920 [Mucilaginibacter corticis]|uniref:Uncharacterized protein n=1 Tax=Mucilaginibacter corticis TaxID=2597670 RepID=A0A556ML48_9SPHI|nr:hypothetical protein [Mucilaginibacter corticis]TSJ40644.1 hypothetical protein FO440_12920 [Mucilaginibacter corticis]